MSSYNRNSRSGGGKYRGGDFRRRDSVPREMHRAVCDECGNNCEVPFRPSKDKPIYCSECFERKEGGDSGRSGRRDYVRSRGDDRDNTNKQMLEQLTALNTKLNKILAVIEPKLEKKEAIKGPEDKKVTKKTTPKVEKVEKVKTTKKKSSITTAF